MTSSLYRTCYLIAPVSYFQTRVSVRMIGWSVLLFCMVNLYLIHDGKGKEFIRAFLFNACALLTLTGLKLMGARDYLSILVLTFSAIIKLLVGFCLVIVLRLRIKTSFLLTSTRVTNTLT